MTAAGMLTCRATGCPTPRHHAAQHRITVSAAAGPSRQIDDLVEEEENPVTARRGIGNLLLCYNTELRMLYDKYCKRPSHHLPAKAPRLSFSLLAAQVRSRARGKEGRSSCLSQRCRCLNCGCQGPTAGG